MVGLAPLQQEASYTWQCKRLEIRNMHPSSIAQNEQTDEIEETVFYIAGHLGETKKRPLAQIHQIVTVLGSETALDYLKKARAIEQQGGMVSISGKKRRTVGGVFFYLVRAQCDTYTLALIWPDVSKEANHE